MSKILLKGGTLVSAKGTKRADVLISGEKIVAVGRHLNTDAKVVNVSGKLIFPGFIDAGTHFDLDTGDLRTADDFESGTRAAVAGGVTTVVDAAVQHRGESLTDALNNWHVKAFANASCDYAFHMTLTDWRDEVRDELPAMFEQGVTSFKVSMAGRDRLSDRAIFEIADRLRELGGVIGCRCENGDIIDKLREQALARGTITPAALPLTQPGYAEEEAVRRFLTIARAAEAPCVTVLLSTAEGVHEIQRARAAGVKIFAETYPRYLLLQDDVYSASPDRSGRYVCSPPLRTAEDNRALWQALRSGALDGVSSGHCAYTLAQKCTDPEDFTAIPDGMPGVETRAALLYTYGVKKNHLSLSQMCAYLSENPARLYGMYPKKGVIRVGADADLTVFDPHGGGTITGAGHSRCGYSLYEGVRTVGGVEKVYLRGRKVYSDGEVTLEDSGRYVPCKRYDTKQ